jgi:hypothetical protein
LGIGAIVVSIGASGSPLLVVQIQPGTFFSH